MAAHTIVRMADLVLAFRVSTGEDVHLLHSRWVCTGIEANQHGVSRAEDIGKGLEEARGIPSVEVACDAVSG